MKAIVRRARLEHLATELLRLSNALRLPVPVEQIYLTPPHSLWHIAPRQTSVYPLTPEDALQSRFETARAVARLTGECGWETRLQLIGDKPFSPSEVDIFAIALLMPTSLLAGISERQRTPETVATIFQVPLNQVTMRLAELGYLSPQESQHVADEPTG